MRNLGFSKETAGRIFCLKGVVCVGTIALFFGRTVLGRTKVMAGFESRRWL